MKIKVLLLVIALVLSSVKSCMAAPEITGIGIISASNSEEYQTIPIRYDNDPTIKPYILNWMEILAKEGYPFGEYRISGASWPSTANYGYEFNWAKSGATSSDAIVQQQHTHLASQISEGKVSHVMISIGANDFNPFLSPQNNNGFIRLYNGTDTVETRVNQVYGNLSTLINTVQAAHPEIIIVNQIPNPFIEPQVQALYPNPQGQERITKAIDQINHNINLRAASDSTIGVASTIEAYTNYIKGSKANSQGFLFGTDDYQIYTNRFGFDGQSYRLADDIGHPGTVFSGIEANGIFIRVLNEQFGYNLPYVTEDEILAYAGVIPFPTSILSDIEPLGGDGDVDRLDYNLLVSNFGIKNDCNNIAQLDNDCDVDIFDYNRLVKDFGVSR